MLTIRMQRRGRSGHAQFRVVVQDSRFSPTSGRVVAYVGNYDPHTKAATLNGEKISAYLGNGAQPSDRVAKLLTKEGIKVPSWFTPAAPKKKKVRNPDKRRSTRPKGAPEPEPKAEAVEKSADDSVVEESALAHPAEEKAVEKAVEEVVAEEAPTGAPAEDKIPDTQELVAGTKAVAEPAAGSKPEVEQAPKNK